MLFALACGHERPVADGRFEVARFRIDPKARFFYVSARGPLPRRFARSFRRTPAGERSIRCCGVEKRANVPTILWSSTLAYSIQIPTGARCASVHVVNRPGPPGELPLLWPSARLAPLGRERTKPEQWCGVTHVADAGRLLAFEDVLAKFGQSMPLRASHADTSFKSPHRNSGGTGRVAWSVTNLSCARRPQARLICELRGEGSDDGHQLANKEKVMVGFFEPHGHAPRTSLRY